MRRPFIFYSRRGVLQAGGQYVNVEHVKALRSLGLRSAFLSLSEQTNDVPDCVNVAFASAEQFVEGDVIVVPEPIAGIVSKWAAGPYRVICHNQNSHYTFMSCGSSGTYAKLGIDTHIVCSNFIARELEGFGIAGTKRVVRPFLLPAFDCAPDDLTEMSLASRGLTLAFMPRKRRIEARLILGLFRSRFPRHSDVALAEIKDVARDDVPRHLRRAQVFLSLSEMEGLGLPPLEAMRAGALVCGFHGNGGMEYASAENGFWYGSDELEAVVERLGDLFDRLKAGDHLVAMRRQAYADAGAFNKDAFTAQLLAAYRSILGASFDDYVIPERER